MSIEQQAKTSPILYVLVVLVALNLAATSALFFREQVVTTGALEAINALPSYLTDTEIEKLKARVIALYNDHDLSAFYAEFDDIVKVQISEAEMASTFDKLYTLAERIEAAAYVNFSEAKVDGEPRTYVLKFQVKIGGSEYTKGFMTITVMDRVDRYGLIGFYLNPQIAAGG